MLNRLEKHNKTKENLKLTPEVSGVYIFFQHKKNPIYVGKAINLRKRLSSYFSNAVFGKTKQMVGEADSFSYIRVSSELEALLLEAKLINKFMPRYNIELKDDKHPLYIKITKDYFPQVLTARKIDIENSMEFYGPFPSSTSVKTVLRLLRKLFPYAQHIPSKRPCLYSQIGLCSPCPTFIESIKDKNIKTVLTKKYKKNIKMISLFLSGNLKVIKKTLEKEIHRYVINEEFENAAIIRDKIKILDYITQPVTPIDRFIENPNFLDDIRGRELGELFNILKPYAGTSKVFSRIECFDVAHIGGTATTASMVTFVGGEPEKNLYRRFKIYQKRGNDDVASLREVAKRRVKHASDWGLSDLIIVDGGKGQLSVFLEAFSGQNCIIVGLAKREETLVIPVHEVGPTKYKLIKVPKGPALNLVQRIRDEAHRFARQYHFKIVKDMLLPK